MSSATLMEPVTRRPRAQSGRRAAVSAKSSRSRRGAFDAGSRADRLLERRIEYIPGDWSRMTDEEHPVCGAPEPQRLLAADEAALFRRMNYLKHRAERLRRLIASGDVSSSRALVTLERLWDESMDLRNYLVQVFSKLAVSVARPYANPEFRLDELLSEAHVTLLRCVEIFDADRGYRFSTYATNAIRHNLNRYISRQHKLRRATREYVPSDDLMAAAENPRRREREYTARMSGVNRWMRKLDARERKILQSRYGLSHESGKVTLQSLADQLGLSRERIRQLELRAIEKLRAMARCHSLEYEG
jgi:RNA polymerase primary sigma factor